MSIREDTPFSDIFSEFFGSAGWVRLGSALISLSVKERILNHMVSSSKESFLCSSETFLKQKHPQTVHFTQPAASKALSSWLPLSGYLSTGPAFTRGLQSKHLMSTCLTREGCVRQPYLQAASPQGLCALRIKTRMIQKKFRCQTVQVPSYSDSRVHRPAPPNPSDLSIHTYTKA